VIEESIDSLNVVGDFAEKWRLGNLPSQRRDLHLVGRLFHQQRFTFFLDMRPFLFPGDRLLSNF
jgi:hypothetical protein